MTAGTVTVRPAISVTVLVVACVVADIATVVVAAVEAGVLVVWLVQPARLTIRITPIMQAVITSENLNFTIFTSFLS
jgi:hypothetical protein